MRIVFKSFTKPRLPKKIILLVLVVIILFGQMSDLSSVIRFSPVDRDNLRKKTIITYQNLLFTHGSVDDTSKPVITFIQPINNSIISETIFSIIINITDDNPPLPGYVIIQISNYTDLLFSALMSPTVDDKWFYNWGNLTLYPNQAFYIIRVWANDSSSNGNNIWSEEFYIFISTPSRGIPDILNLILSLTIVSIIIAAIIVYINKKVFYKSGKKKRDKIKGVFKD